MLTNTLIDRIRSRETHGGSRKEHCLKCKQRYSWAFRRIKTRIIVHFPEYTFIYDWQVGMNVKEIFSNENIEDRPGWNSKALLQFEKIDILRRYVGWDIKLKERVV